jgi:alpha-D-xyloside xylohydrolase
MGPYLQYATEKKSDPIEIRIYTGKNAEFVLYEDENDTYNYESGKYSTIDINWDEAGKILTIKDRKGDFPGMLENRTFNLVWVKEKSGTGVEPSKPAQIVSYSGKEIKIKK